MATKISDGASTRVVVEVTDSTCATLESDPETNRSSSSNDDPAPAPAPAPVTK
jgi:hypothetical protein